MAPFFTPQWPNPSGRVYALPLRTALNGPLGRDVALSHPVYDWPNPKARTYPGGLRTMLNGPLGAGPGNPNVPPPWPVVPARVYSATLRTVTNATRFNLTDATYGLGGYPTFDFPNPKRAHFPDALRTASCNLSQSTLIPPASIPTPFAIPSWQTAGARPYSTVLRTALNGPLGAGSSALPPLPSITWPLTPGRVHPASLRTFAGYYVIDTSPQIPIPGTETLAPRAREYASSLRTFTNSTRVQLADTIFAVGGPSYDWPNPRAATFPIALRTALRATPSLFADAIYGAPGQAPVYDWPTPKRPMFVEPLRTWTQGLAAFLSQSFARPFVLTDAPNPTLATFSHTLRTTLGAVQLSLIGQDQFFGGAGQPPPPQTWPNPARPVFPPTLRTTISRAPMSFFHVEWAANANRVIGPSATQQVLK